MKIHKQGTPELVLWVIVVLLAIFVWIESTAMAQTEKAPRGGTLKITREEPTHLNSALITGPATAIPACQIFIGLLQFDENFQPKPYLARKWEVSPDGLFYTFHLEKEALFHDGKPITSADVAFSLETVKKNHPLGALAFEAVEKVETPEPHTAIFKLKYPSLVPLVATHPFFLPILPKHIYGDGEIRKHPANLKPTIGSGPFKFVEWKKGQYILLERNENFFCKGRPYLDRIIMEFISDPAAAAIAMETGTVHVAPAGFLAYPDFHRLEKIPHLVVTLTGSAAVGPRGFLGLNVRKSPLNDNKVRRAIAHSINKEFIAKEILMGFAKPAVAHLRYSSPFHNPNVQQYDYNPNKANQLLDEAGFKRGADGTRFDLSIDFFPGAATPKVVSEFLREELKKTGVRGTLRTSPDLGTWAQRLSNWEYEMNYYPLSDFPDPAIGLGRLFTSKNIKKIPFTNTMGYSNPEVDRLCDEAGKELNFEKRKKLYHRIQEILADELPGIFITDAEWPTVYNKEFDGIPMDVWGIVNPLDTVFWRKGKVGK